MATMDVFSGSAFSAISLTGAINQQPFLPSLLGDLNLFTDRPIRTRAAYIENLAGTLSLVPTSPIGAPLAEDVTDKRTVQYIPTLRIAKGTTIYAEEVQGVRAFGSETELQQIANLVAERSAKISRDIQYTWENMRLGAVQGIVYDSNGTTVLQNWYTIWGVVQPAEVDWDLDNATPVGGAIYQKCNDAIRAAMRAVSGMWIPGRSYLIGLCGDNFYDNLTQAPEVRATYLSSSQAQDLRNDVGGPFSSFRYGGIVFMNYRGTDTAGLGINTDKIALFPVGVPGLFEVAWGPGETFDFVNTPGKPLYLIPVKDTARNAWQRIEAYSYPLFFCTKPLALLRGKRT